MWEYTPPSRRELEEQTYEDFVKIEETNDKKQDSMLFNVLFIISQLGGFWTFTVFVFGLIISPIVQRIFYRDALRDIKKGLNVVLVLLKVQNSVSKSEVSSKKK